MEKIERDVDCKNTPQTGFRMGLFANRYGCGKCEHRGVASCPYGVGVDCFTGDVLDKFYNVVFSKGEVKRFYVNEGSREVLNTPFFGICPDRYHEYGMMLKTYNDLSGLRALRSENLMKLNGLLGSCRGEADKVISQGDLTVTNEDGDVKLKMLLEQVERMQSKFIDKIEQAIGQEERFEAAKAKSGDDKRKVTADDINEVIKRAKLVDVGE